MIRLTDVVDHFQPPRLFWPQGITGNIVRTRAIETRAIASSIYSLVKQNCLSVLVAYPVIYGNGIRHDWRCYYWCFGNHD